MTDNTSLPEVDLRLVVRCSPGMQEILRMKDLKQGDVFQLFEGDNKIGDFWRATSNPYVSNLSPPPIWGINAEPVDPEIVCHDS